MERYLRRLASLALVGTVLAACGAPSVPSTTAARGARVATGSVPPSLLARPTPPAHTFTPPVASIPPEQYVVATSTGEPLSVRVAPGTTATRITSLPNGTVVEVIGSGQPQDGYTWVPIQTGDVHGWCIREALTGAAVTTDPVPAPTADASPRKNARPPTPRPAYTAPTLPPTNAPQPPPRPAGQCDPSYPTACIPPLSTAGNLDCADVPYREFAVVLPDPHYFDGDGDGIGCEFK